MRLSAVVILCCLTIFVTLPQGIAQDQTQFQAQDEAQAEDAAEDATPVKAAWVTRWAFKSPSDVESLFERLKPIGINRVFFQVRGACDALYLSSYEPWSDVLTGTLGKHPGWDPLETAIDNGRRLGIEVHAWINVFPAWQVNESGEPPPTTIPLHVMRVHPAWLAQDINGQKMPLVKADAKHNYAFLSPTHPAAQEHIQTVVEDLVKRYELDGLHLDYVRFPDSSYSYDYKSRSLYLNALRNDSLSFADWRRKNLTAFVGTLAYTARLVRPGIEVSAAVWQKIASGRNEYLQDGIEWVRRGYVDLLVPMIYTTSVASFEERLKAYVDSVGPQNVVAGMGPYLDGFTDSLFVAELEVTRAHGVRGISVLNSDYVLQYSSVLEGFTPGPRR
jgi:uncharacterized lipoprotein YddW (UPF0748 family)